MTDGSKKERVVLDAHYAPPSSPKPCTLISKTQNSLSVLSAVASILTVARTAGMNVGALVRCNLRAGTCLLTASIAYALTLLAGKQGYNGWRWIFIIEGAIAIFLGILAFLVLPDFPDKATFVTEEQRKACPFRI